MDRAAAAPSCATQEVVIAFDLPGGRTGLQPEDVRVLRDAAAARAGRSLAARDLSLLLDRALERGSSVALRRAEVQTLIEVAREAALDEVAAELARLAGG
jgi:hypothetical protein